MEQAGYWMCTKRKRSLSSHFPSATSYDDSWEEQAFAEDAAGPLGGCIWPPRSYSCSFCRREFRSAQALGGHMNVHRRDRARLKQSSSSPHNEIHHDQDQNSHNHLQNPFTSLNFQYPSQVCTLVYSPNPNSDPAVLASPTSPSRVSSLPTDQENRQEKISLVPLSSPLVQDQHKRSPISSLQSWSKLVADKCHNISDLKNGGEDNSRFLESACSLKADYVKTDLSVSLNLVVRRTRSTLSDGKQEAVGSKRRRIETSSLPLFLTPSSVDDTDRLQSEEQELSPNFIEDLDLELRLGDRPKVK